MKYLYLLIFLAHTSFSFGQNRQDDLPDLEVKSGSESNTVSSSPDPTVYTIVEVQPSFPGGPIALKNFIADKVKLVEPKLSGTIYMRVVVGADGTLIEPKVLKNIPNCSNCEKEAIKILTAMPKWSPAEMSGKKVKSYFNMPIKFD